MNASNLSPISVLEHNILHAFENAEPGFVDRLRRSVTGSFVASEIDLSYTLQPPRGPRVTKAASGAPAIIQLDATYLELLWAFIYGWMVRFEEGVMKPLLKSQRAPITCHTHLLPGADRLLTWAASLRHGYVAWPDGLPSPRAYSSTEEQHYGEKTNLVFQQAVSFLLAHEWAHAVNLHLQPELPRPSDLDSIELEKDADIVAMNILVSPQASDTEKLSQAWAMLSAIVSSYYVLRDTDSVKQLRHPQLHHRVQHLFRHLSFLDEKTSGYFHGLGAEVLRDVFVGAEWIDPVGGYDTSEELFYATMDRLDQLMDLDTLPSPFKR